MIRSAEDTARWPAVTARPGDLVAEADANGNHVCYWYDSLHRLTDVGNNHQSASNPCLRYRYDNSTGAKGSYPPGISPIYYWGRMVEAATDDCSPDPLLSDEWFSYSARGEATDFWESTPHSSGWYHTANGMAPDGVVSSRRGYLGTLCDVEARGGTQQEVATIAEKVARSKKPNKPE